MLKTLLAIALTLATSNISLAADSATKPRGIGAIINEAPNTEWRTPNLENVLYMELTHGRVIIELAPQFAPNHVKNIKALAREGFYDGLNFYRVIDGFVAQGGDSSDSKKPKKAQKMIEQEFQLSIDNTFSYTPVPDIDGFAAHNGFKDGFAISLNAAKSNAWLTHCSGVLAMARSNSVDSGGTEIYITLNNQRYLDGNITVFGRVLDGMAHIQALKRSQNLNGPVDLTGQNIIKTVSVAADVEPAKQTLLQVMKTDSSSFKELISARRNRPEEWFVATPNHVDVCSVQVPIKLTK